MCSIRISALASAIGAVLVIAGCSSGSDGTGSLSVSVTDGPADDAAEVWLYFSGVELQRANGGRVDIDFATPKEIELIGTQGGNAAFLLEDEEIPAGQYNWLRLKVITDPQSTPHSYVLTKSGGQVDLVIPSNDQTGLKLIRGFTMPVGGAANFVIDVDLRQSLLDPLGLDPYWVFKPVLRIMDMAEVGTITGNVNPTLLTADGCTPGVYLFNGGQTTPDDLDTNDGDGLNALTSLATEVDGSFRIDYVPAGEYTLAFTCDFADDLPESSEALVFDPVANDVVVNDGQTTDVQLGF